MFCNRMSYSGVVAGWLLAVPGLQAATDTNKPNFLYIQTDQYRYDLIRSVQDEMPRYDGKTKIRTPNLDRLRNEGVYFKNAYTQCAVCGPARSSFRTGNTIERHGQQSNDLYKESVYNRSTQFKNKIEANVTFDQILASKRGYAVEHFGKWHLPRIYNFATNKTTQIMRYNNATFTGMTNDTDYANLVYSFVNSDESFRYELRLAEVSAGLSTNQLPGMQKDTYSRFPYVTDAIDTRFGLPPYATNSVGQPDQQGRSTLPANKTSSCFEGTAAIGALDRMARGSEPFCLTASFHNPHAPMVATGLYYDYYKGLEDGMLLPDSLSGADMANSGWSSHTNLNYRNPGMVREWMVSYYALCEEVDTYVGLLLDKLDQYNIASNTLVIFVADHGEALGSHGTREKNTFLEESAHVPLLMRFPGKMAAGTVVEEPVATLDCVATTLDYLGAGAHNVSDGRSLRRFIEKKNYNETFDDEAIVTEWDFRTPQTGGTLDRSLGGEVNFLCRKGPWKLMITKKASSTKIDMLYNIETDPYEMNNYIGNNGMTASDAAVGKAEHLKCLLIEWMQRMDGGTNQYFSNPVYNYGEGMGDIAEVSARRKWKTMNMWVSDTAVEVGSAVDVSGQLTRNEYIYLGRSTAGTLTISNMTVQGADAGRIQLSGFTSGSMTNGEYRRVKLTYLPTYAGQPITDARVVIANSAGSNQVIELSTPPSTNALPSITSTPAPTAETGVVYNYTLMATDAETNALSYSAIVLPVWLSFNTNTAVLSGRATTNELGSHSVTLQVRDPYGITNQSFSIWVSRAGNDVPVITSVPSTGVIASNTYTYTISATDGDLDPLTYSATTKPAWLNFNSETRVLSGTPASSNVGTHRIELAVTDGLVSVTQQFNLVVFTIPPPAMPVKNGSFELGSPNPTNWTLGGSATNSTNVFQHGVRSLMVRTTTSTTPTRQTVPLQVGIAYRFSVWINATGVTSSAVLFNTGYPGEGRVVVYSNAGWTQYSGTFTATNVTMILGISALSNSFVGTAYVDNIVVDPYGLTNNAPIITSIPLTNAAQNEVYRYTFLAADAEGDALTYTGVTVPAWLSFNTTNGLLSGIPTGANAGAHPVALSVSDGSVSVTQNFTIVVDGVVSGGYDEWASTNGVGAPEVDNDNDGFSNLYEYALNGDPTDDQDNGVDPGLVMTGSGLEYIHIQRRDDASLIYLVELRTNLLTGGWIAAGYTVLGTNSYNADYDQVRYGLVTTNEASYIRLYIQQQ